MKVVLRDKAMNRKMQGLSSGRDQININCGRIPKYNNTSNRCCICIGDIFPIHKSQPVQAGYPRELI
jgi:hypothetical protein